jgi:hypothetical protein
MCRQTGPRRAHRLRGRRRLVGRKRVRCSLVGAALAGSQPADIRVRAAPRRGQRPDGCLWLRGGDYRRPAARASASRCPSRKAVQKALCAEVRCTASSWGGVRPRMRCPKVPRHGSRQRRASLRQKAFDILLDPSEVGRTPSRRVAFVARWEDRPVTGDIADESPGLVANRFVERMRVSDLGRDGPTAVRAGGAQREVHLGAERAALSGHARPRTRSGSGSATARAACACAILLSESAPDTREVRRVALHEVALWARTGSTGA